MDNSKLELYVKTWFYNKGPQIFKYNGETILVK